MEDVRRGACGRGLVWVGNIMKCIQEKRCNVVFEWSGGGGLIWAGRKSVDW